MDDKHILMRLLQQAYTDEALGQPARKEFERLVVRFDEDNAEAEYPVSDLDEDLERALRNLSETGYTTQSLRYHGPNDGHILHVNLRGKKFLDMADSRKAVPVEPELPDVMPQGWRQSSLMQDSGKRQQFDTGAVRDSADEKSRPDLISPFAAERLGNWLMLGARKYTERNWERGIPVSRSLASLYRHLLKYQQGATDEDHLAAIMCNAMFLIHTEEMIRRGVLPKSLADLPDYNAIPAIHRNGDEILDHEPDEEFRWRAIHEKHNDNQGEQLHDPR